MKYSSKTYFSEIKKQFYLIKLIFYLRIVCFTLVFHRALTHQTTFSEVGFQGFQGQIPGIRPPSPNYYNSQHISL